MKGVRTQNGSPKPMKLAAYATGLINEASYSSLSITSFFSQFLPQSEHVAIVSQEIMALITSCVRKSP